MEGILLDTNFLLLPASVGVDVYSELRRVCEFPYKLFVLSGSYHELGNMTTGKLKVQAKIAKELAEKHTETIESHGHVDDALVALSREQGYYVATQDKPLRDRLRKENLPVIFLRQKKYIIVEK